LWLKTLYRKRAVTWPFIFYTIIWTLSFDTPESCCQNFIQYTDAVEPLLQNVEKYHKIYQQCRKIYPATKEICHDL
ncbi:xylulose kinase, partial [Enterococcus faecium]